MNEPKQMGLFDQNTDSLQPEVEYIAPAPKVVDEYAHAVCRALDEKFSLNLGNRQAEFVRGFATFVKVIVQIQVKHLNKGVSYGEQESIPTREA